MNFDPVGQKTLDVMSQAKNYNTRLLTLIHPHLTSPVVEIGAGIGTFTKELVAKGLDVTAIDLNVDYLKKLAPPTRTFVLDIQSSVLPRSLYHQFNSAIAINVIEHIVNHVQAIKNIYDLLKSDGVAVILVPAHMWAFGSLDKGLGHIRRYSKSTLTSLVTQAGLKVVSCRYYNFFGLLGWWFNSRTLHSQVLPAWQVKIFDRVFYPFLKLESFLPLPIGLSLICVAKKIKKSQ